MQELISITTDEQGSSVVSARELHSFLEVKSRFNDWIKNRIIKYGFLEDTDYVTLTKVLVSGGIEHDYALTLDMAKQLAMVERNEKGKRARLYFIEAEKALRQLIAAPALPPAQQLLQQAQLLVSHEGRIDALEKALNGLVEREQHRLELSGPSRPRAVHTLRSQVVQLLNQYAENSNLAYYKAWNQLYDRLHLVYGFNVRAQRKTTHENLLDVAERHGQLDRLFSLLNSELNYPEE